MISVPRLLLATNNQGKTLEIHSLLQHLRIELVRPADLGLHLEVLEDGRSYAANATKKALAFAKATNMVVLADDSGLELDTLNGAPGLHSARYSPLANASDKDRRDFLLARLTGKPRPWTALFRATIAVASPAGEVHLVEGTCAGEIIPEERGDSGFGYDPIFQLEGLGLTMAELNMDDKNRLSHRGNALRKAIPILIDIFGLEESETSTRNA
jgi:XTP/dITP diphosphohydrolase